MTCICKKISKCLMLCEYTYWWLWKYLQRCSLNHWVFRVFQHHTPSSRWPNQCWSDWLVSRWLSSYHVSMDFLSWATPILWPSLPLPADGSALPLSSNAQRPEDSGQRMGRETSATYLHWEAPRSPSSLMAVAGQTHVIGELPFKGFFKAVLPWDSAPAIQPAWCAQTPKQWCRVVAATWLLSLDVHQPLPVFSRSRDAGKCSSGCKGYLLWQRWWFLWRDGAALPTQVLQWWLWRWSCAWAWPYLQRLIID